MTALVCWRRRVLFGGLGRQGAGGAVGEDRVAVVLLADVLGDLPVRLQIVRCARSPRAWSRPPGPRRSMRSSNLVGEAAACRSVMWILSRVRGGRDVEHRVGAQAHGVDHQGVALPMANRVAVIGGIEFGRVLGGHRSRCGAFGWRSRTG